MANCIYGTFVIVLLSMVELSYTQIESPCPDVFFYSRGAKGLYGDVTVPSQLIKNNLILRVILSYEDPLPSQYQGYIELQGEQSTALINSITKLDPIKYTVNFPQKTQNFYIQSIDFNDIELCSGAPPLEANRKIVLHHKLVINESESQTRTKHHNPTVASPALERTRTKYHNPTVASPAVERTRTKHHNPTVASPAVERTRTKHNPKITSIIFSHLLDSRHRERRFANYEQNSDENYSSLFSKEQLRSKCGRETNISTRKWPWISAVYMQGLTERRMVSSGALISDIFIVTAAQPVSFLNNQPTPPEKLSVRIGAYNLEDEDDESSSPRIVQQIIFHPEFKPNRLKVQNNIALLRIKPLHFNQFLAPVCLIRSSRNIGSELIKGQVVGWGKDVQNELNIYSNEIEMQIYPAHECINAHPMFPRYLKPNNFCARSDEISELCDEEQGKGFYTKKLESTRWVLAGILTYSVNKFPDRCKIEKTRLFSDLSKDADWIEDILFNDNF